MLLAHAAFTRGRSLVRSQAPIAGFGFVERMLAVAVAVRPRPVHSPREETRCSASATPSAAYAVVRGVVSPPAKSQPQASHRAGRVTAVVYVIKSVESTRFRDRDCPSA
jgi:hypothetical protein